jgi:sporulation protein YlmC with PRC-barrel domain
MRIGEEILGKTIVDPIGNELGKVDDLEVDWENKIIEALVVKGKGKLSPYFDSERFDSIKKKLGVTTTEDLLIPVEEIQAIGNYVVIKKKIDPKTTT